MDVKTLVKLHEAAMRSETLGTDFEKVVLAELLKYVKGVEKVIPPNKTMPENAPTIKVAELIKPSFQSVTNSISKDGVYDVNKQQKLESTHPDFILKILPGKRFFGFTDEWKIHVEAKYTSTGRFRFGQNKVDNIFIDEDSQSFKYLMWFGYRKDEYMFNRDRAIQEFNSLKRKFLDIFKILSGHDYRLIHAVPDSPVQWLILDDTVDLLKGHFDISPRGVLRFVFEKEDLFILEKVSTGDIRMYSKEKVMKDKAAKLTPFKKVEESSGNTIILYFKALKEIKSALGKNLSPDPKAEVLVKAGQIIKTTVVTGGAKPAGAAVARSPQLLAADTKVNNLLDKLSEEICSD